MRTRPNRVASVIATASLFALWLIAPASFAQTYPSKPIRLVVGFPPGGAADFVARALSDPLSRELGQSIVIDNRPGAGSSIAAEHVGTETSGSRSPEEFAAFLEENGKLWQRMVRDSGAKLD